jgi:hypothetical protein
VSAAPRWFGRPAAILAAALALRLLLVLPALGSPPFSDEADYHQLACNLAAGRGYVGEDGRPTAWRPPLWPAAMAVVYRVAGDRPAAARLAQVVLGTLLVGLVLALAAAVEPDDRAATALAGWWATLSPALLYYSCSLFSETLYALCLAASLLLLLRPRRRWSAVAAGVLLGLACLARGATLVLAPLLLLWLGRRDGWRAAAALAAGLALSVGPWTARNAAVLGAPIPVDTNGAANFFWGNHPQAPLLRAWDIVERPDKPSPVVPPGAGEVAAERAALAQASAFVGAAPGRFGLGLVLKSGNLWGLERGLASGLRAGLFGSRGTLLVVPAALWGLLDTALLLSLAILGLARARRRDAVWLALAVMASLTLVHAASYGHSRYRFGALPLLLVFAAQAAADWRREGRPRPPRWARAAIALALINLAYEAIVLEFAHRCGWV